MPRSDAEKPRYQQILETLSTDILSGRYGPGQKFPSEAALVKRFGVSRITVGHAVKDLQQRGLVERIAGSGTYVRRAEGSPRKGLLFGLIIPNLGEAEIFAPICQGIASGPEAADHALLWAHADSAHASREEQALQLCRQCIARGVAGVFFAPLEWSAKADEVNHKVLRMLQEQGIPVVLLDRRPTERLPRERCDLVGIDNHLAGFLATDHLLRLGAQKIGFLAYEHQALTVRSRIAGYQEALQTPGGTAQAPVVLRASSGEKIALSGELAACDAFVCANDRIAGHLMHALLAQRVRIPQDVRIVGIDDVTYASLLPIPLTTIHQPCHDIGEAALRVMLERMDRPRMPARDVLLDCQLVVRESCGGGAAAAAVTGARDGSVE